MKTTQRINKDVMDEIVINIYQSGWLKKQCKQFVNKDTLLLDDFVSEVILLLLEKPLNVKFINLYLTNDKWEVYLKTIIKNIYINDDSKFYKLFRSQENNISLDKIIEKENEE